MAVIRPIPQFWYNCPMSEPLPLITPMRLSQAKQPFDSPDWIFELKQGSTAETSGSGHAEEERKIGDNPAREDQLWTININRQ